MVENYKPGTKIRTGDPTELSGLEDRFYTVAEVAEMFEVSEYTARAWCRDGQIVATKESRKAGYRIPRSSLVDFAIQRYIF